MTETTETINQVEQEVTINKKKVDWPAIGVTIVYNSFATFILGVFPTLILYYALPQAEFKKIFAGFMPKDMMVVYYACIAVIGFYFKIHNYFALKECVGCDKNNKIHKLPNKMIQPLLSVYHVFSGLLITAGFIGFSQHDNLIPTFLFVLAFILLGLISLIDSTFVSTEKG